MIAAIIPARFNSTRFPGKPLAEIRGESMISRVYHQAKKARSIERVVVATDDNRIAEHVRSFGGEVVITSGGHISGTDRCYEALGLLGHHYQYVINVQGDEPFIDPAQIDLLTGLLKDGNTELATLIGVIRRKEMLTDPGEVKVVIDKKGEALYFSRQPIPYLRGVDMKNWLENHTYYYHVGLYAYRSDILEKITKLPVSLLERAESLEQLRWLEHGYRIKCAITDKESYCIETPEDIDKVLRIIASNR
ncbi:MAG TPA: 3-deoxy-manno-octulosonate cytidylyltransferase [Chitinophagaceae bacterium]|nr:3-deoxy-manno-octulosonate cytidylyltransferase [Chitinophagaceae bacterium]